MRLLGERATESQELRRNDPVYIPVLNLVVEIVRVGLEVQVDVAQERGVGDGTGAVEHLQVVRADAERGVSKRG